MVRQPKVGKTYWTPSNYKPVDVSVFQIALDRVRVSDGNIWVGKDIIFATKRQCWIHIHRASLGDLGRAKLRLSYIRDAMTKDFPDLA